MASTELLRQHRDEADLGKHGALVERLGAEETVDVAGPQVGDHLGRRRYPQLHVAVRVQPVLGEVIAQQEVVHRIFRSEEHTSELQSLMRISYAVFCLKKKKNHHNQVNNYIKI